MNPLPEIKLGTGDQGSIVIPAELRSRGSLIVGPPGSGRSTLLTEMALQDVEKGCPVLFVAEEAKSIINLIPKSRHNDIVVLSLLPDEIPYWPVLDQARSEDEALVVAKLLNDAWRAQYGDAAVGARSESILAYALMALPITDISPVEVLAVISSKEYRLFLLDHKQRAGVDFPLEMWWDRTVSALTERTFQDWANSVTNKLAPMVLDHWLRRALCGTPPWSGMPTMSFKDVIGNPDLASVMWRRDRTMIVRLNSDEEPSLVMINDELEDHLIDEVSLGRIFSKAHQPDGYATGRLMINSDTQDESLQMPSEEAYANNSLVVEHISRRRRRRGWRRFADFYLAPRNITVKETMDIADLLDDGRIVIVEIPQTHGTDVSRAVATLAILSNYTRGLRMLALPNSLRVPCAVYIDNADLFLSASLERQLDELRKAGVSMNMTIQRLGQLGLPSSPLRRGVLAQIGALIALGSSLEEAEEIATALGFKSAEIAKVLKLSLGHGQVNMPRVDGARVGSEPFDFSALASPPEDISQGIRQRSIDRFYQTPEAADGVFRQRVLTIRAKYAGKKQTRAAAMGFGAQVQQPLFDDIPPPTPPKTDLNP